MVSNDYQEMAIAALRYTLQRYRSDWYVSSDLPILCPRPNNTIGQVAPDIMVAFVHNHPRDAFDVRVEGGFPPFVLEVVSTESRPRDTGKNKKVRTYNLLSAQEYAIFDPRAKRRPPLSGYRRTSDGGWEEWPLDTRGALRSAGPHAGAGRHAAAAGRCGRCGPGGTGRATGGTSSPRGNRAYAACHAGRDGAPAG
jgi:Uma2 family endonuclease